MLFNIYIYIFFLNIFFVLKWICMPQKDLAISIQSYEVSSFLLYCSVHLLLLLKTWNCLTLFVTKCFVNDIYCTITDFLQSCLLWMQFYSCWAVLQILDFSWSCLFLRLTDCYSYCIIAFLLLIVDLYTGEWWCLL